MPQKVTVTCGNVSGRYVPHTARMSCYHCGTLFPTADSKFHCELCYDIFCARCNSTRLEVPDATPGVRTVLQVCVSCALLCELFPAYLRCIAEDRGGQLLPPRHSAKVTFFPAVGDGRRSLRSMMTSLIVETNIVLLAWRPLNTQTSLFLGPEHVVPLEDIVDVDFTPQQMCRIQSRKGVSYGLQVFSVCENGVSRQDNLSTHGLCAALQRLTQHTSDHFAFSKAFMGIHPDLCPVTDTFKQRTLSLQSPRNSTRASFVVFVAPVKREESAEQDGN